MNRDELRQEINNHPLTDFMRLDKSKGANMYCCPICGSGTGNKGTGALRIDEYEGKYRVNCFSGNCFNGNNDTLGALEILWNCDETEVMKRCNLAEIDDAGRAQLPRKAKTMQEPTKEENFAALYVQWHNELMQSEEGMNYLKGRGISRETATKFNLGYCANWSHPKTKGAYVSKRIIVPSAYNAYMARRVDDVKEYAKQKAGDGKALFNEACLDRAEVVFISEGEFDAMSFWEVGADAVGIRSIGNSDAMLEAAKRHPEIVYLLALDNDEKEDGTNPGRKAQGSLYNMMQEAGLTVIKCDVKLLYCGEKDANEALTKHREQFKTLVTNGISGALKIKEERDAQAAADLYNRTGAGMVDLFLQEIQEETYKPISTGIKGLDKALEGGFTRKSLVALGAAPGAGKTTLATQILENMARGGNDVLYINLEMSRAQLIARSLARLAYRNNPSQDAKADLSTLQVLRGYKWTEAQRHTVIWAASLYKEKIAPHFVYNPDNVNNSLSSILGACKAEANRLQAEGRPAPLVCIDYLHLIDFDMLGEGERKPDMQESMKRTILALKKFAIDYNTVVLLILAHNRTSNKEGSITMDSGRDTSNIEYSADVMLGLTYTAIEDGEEYTEVSNDKNGNEKRTSKPYNPQAIEYFIKRAKREGRPRPEVANRVCLKVTKNRFGEPFEIARFIFDGKHGNFTEIDTTMQEPDN